MRIISFFCVVFVLVLCGCSKKDASSNKIRTVNFLPNTHIDSLYINYTHAEGVKKVQRANGLLAAIYEETADSLVQFTTGEDLEVVDAMVSYWMSEYFCYSNRYNEAESIALVALEKAPKIKDPSFEIEINSLLGLICQRSGKNEDALKYMQKCYEASCESGNLEDQSSDLSNLAAISLALKNSELAKTYIDKAIKVEQQLNRSDKLAIRYGIASEVYQSLGELDTAEKFARDAFNLDFNDQREGKAAIRLSQLAAVLIAKGNNDEAIKILLQAEPALEANGNNYSLAVVKNQLGSLYLQRGQNATAAAHFKKAYELSKDGGNLYFLQRALTGLANSLKDTDVKEAYKYLDLSTSVADSIYQHNSRKDLAEIEQKYKESEALRAVERKVYERKVQVYALMIVLSLLCLVISVLFFIIRNRNKNKKQKMMKSLEKIRSNFFTNVTHEFRTPITIILGLSQDISEDATASKEVKQAASVIATQGNGLLNLVNQLLDISKVQSEIGSPDWQRGNIVSYIHMIAEKYMPSASQKGVNFEFSPSENDVVIDFVPQYIDKILQNLISNALKFTPKGGCIHITTKVKDNHLELRIADTGVGIASADLSHIFEPYYQGENSDLGVGTGIGLTLVDQMVKAMNGEISAKSTKGKGTTFTVTIPLTHEGKVGEPIENDFAKSEHVKPERLLNIETGTDLEHPDKPIVLIVEDNPEVASYIGHSLGDCTVQYAKNGLEGFVKAQELIPDVIVTDLMMPEMDGLEMTRKIRATMSVNHIPIIMVTAKAENADKVGALKEGVDAYLVKPFNREELETRITQLIMQRRMLCEKYQRAIAIGNVDNDILPVADRQFISNVVGVVNNMIATGEATDLKVVADKLNLSSRTFSRKVQAITGNSPLLYINKIKVNKAATLIDTNPKISLSDVAYQSGFNDPNYFSRIFKQIKGISPTAYRQRVK